MRWIEGNYRSYEAALAASDVRPANFDTLEIQRVKAVHGETGLTVAIVRDGLARVDGYLRVLDFGGSLGTAYLQARDEFAARIAEWRIVEQPEIADYGARHFTDDRLSFFGSIDAACQSFRPNVIIAASALQYLSAPIKILARLAEFGADVIVLDRTPIARRQRVMVHNFYTDYADGSAPYTVLAQRDVDRALWRYQQVHQISLPSPSSTSRFEHAARVYVLRRYRPRLSAHL